MEKIKVVIVNKQKTVKIPTGVRLLMRRCCHAVLELENFQGSAEVDISLVDNQQIREINKEQRNIDMVTDVLSFPLGKTANTTRTPKPARACWATWCCRWNAPSSRRSSTAIPCSGKSAT